ncbi:3987_t:CDS:2 [Cetraspora pellucida]|uniref:3987_t:CDS:1 n=1 Tax=Cetraspora pellucida TaxID=1433469 RepID=A0A9N9G3K0_9GLOM|nr:3987_t:CDS:2 [Cetraspora pellucida]
MSRQTFLSSPKFNKTYIYKSPNTKYQSTTSSQKTKNPEITAGSSSHTAILTTIPIEEEIQNNATAQKQIASSKEIAEKKIKVLEQIYNITTDPQPLYDLYNRIKSLRTDIQSYEKKMQKLKRNAEYQSKCYSKKTKAIVKRQEVVKYDKSSRPSFLLQHSDLLEHIHDSVEYGSADACRCKEAIKVRIYHPNDHYCLASVKGARQFAQTFAEFSVIISQDDKVKISLGIAAVGRTFHTLQSSFQPVQIPDHDFVHRSNQKLIPSVYLIIKPSKANDNLWTGQVAIFVQPQWSIGTSSITHMEDLTCLVLDNQYSKALKVNSNIKPIWILLVNGGPDENSRHLKNIESYCKIFKKFGLDYLSVCTHAPGQSKYNPVEKGMATLSSKLARVVLPIDYFGKHLDSQSRVINNELANKNFYYAGSMLSDIWSQDPIFGKYVKTTYVNKITNPFVNIVFAYFEDEEEKNGSNEFANISVPWTWKEKHCNICQYSVDIKHCTDLSCCKPIRAQEAMDFLQPFNGFLPPITKARDGHYLNPVHLLQYSELFKVPKYDAHCPFIDQTTYSRLCCSICHKYFPTLSYVAKYKRLQHSSTCERLKKKPENLESIAEFVLITNSATMKDLNLPFL